MQAIVTPQLLYVGLAVAGVALFVFLIAIAALAFFLLRKPATSSSGTPGVTGDVTGLTHTAVDWGLLTGVWNAVRDNNKPLLQFELAFLTKLASQLGGPAALFEQLLLNYLEKQIAAGNATPIATKIAALFGVDARTLVDGLEGKSPDPAPAPVKTTSTSGLPVAQAITGLIVLCLTLFSFSSTAQAAPPLRSPERFYPTEVEPTIDPPTFASARVCPGGMCPAGSVSPMVNFQAPPQPAVHFVSVGPVRRGLGWLFGRRCH
jgi:hypothetical protein